ncbi:hypothetical protein [Pasteuria penetrans]|uniref:hypothetical protein n=1 Tax=Pasteuria penetrans TaxID=86005 RepID=UPI0011EECE87|nr:hypothetical protein [Pasteuria penetrans]
MSFVSMGNRGKNISKLFFSLILSGAYSLSGSAVPVDAQSGGPLGEGGSTQDSPEGGVNERLTQVSYNPSRGDILERVSGGLVRLREEKSRENEGYGRQLTALDADIESINTEIEGKRKSMDDSYHHSFHNIVNYIKEQQEHIDDAWAAVEDGSRMNRLSMLAEEVANLESRGKDLRERVESRARELMILQEGLGKLKTREKRFSALKSEFDRQQRNAAEGAKKAKKVKERIFRERDERVKAFSRSSSGGYCLSLLKNDIRNMLSTPVEERGLGFSRDLAEKVQSLKFFDSGVEEVEKAENFLKGEGKEAATLAEPAATKEAELETAIPAEPAATKEAELETAIPAEQAATKETKLEMATPAEQVATEKAELETATPAEQAATKEAKLETAAPAEQAATKEAKLETATPAEQTETKEAKLETATPVEQTETKKAKLETATPAEQAATKEAKLETATPAEQTETKEAKLETATPAEQTETKEAKLETATPAEQAETKEAKLETATPAERAATKEAKLETAAPAEQAATKEAKLETATPAEQTETKEAKLETATPVEQTETKKAKLETATPVEQTETKKAKLETATPAEQAETKEAKLETATPAEQAETKEAKLETVTSAEKTVTLPVL